MKLLLSISLLIFTFNTCYFKQKKSSKECLNISYNLSQFTKIDTVTGEYSLDKVKLKKYKTKSKIECNLLKLNEPFYEFHEPFYEVFEQKFENYTVIGYYNEGYSDIVKATFFNLAIYNLKNEIIDCLILDSRYKFEIEYFKEINVNNNCEIEILDYQNKELVEKHYFKISNNGTIEEVSN